MSLIVKDLTVRYGRKRVLDALGLDAQPGQITAIVGPNGSGKSTLIKAVCGDLPYDGSISLNGLDISRAEPWRLAALRGVLPQASVLAFPFHVIEVVRIGLQAGSGAEHDGRAETALARVGLLGTRTATIRNCQGASSSGYSWPACWHRCGSRFRITARAG